MREKFQRFMQGRYGADELSRFLTMVGLILIVVNLFFRSVLLSYVVLAILIYCYYRMFSRNYSRRYAENQKFLSWRNRLRLKPSSWKREMCSTWKSWMKPLPIRWRKSTRFCPPTQTIWESLQAKNDAHW